MTKIIVTLLVAGMSLKGDFEAGLRAFQAKDYGDALTQFMPDAERGDGRAQNALGYLYERGLGISKNEENAARWYRKSAEQGYGPGEYNYGLACWHGTGVQQNDTEAVKWLERAAGHGVDAAELDLGNFYYKQGKGDINQALSWWRKAAEHHVPAAAYNVAYLYAEGPGFSHDYGQAAQWYREAAMENYPLAQYALALLYQSGKGVQADPTEARMWLELAARGGVEQARQEMSSQKPLLTSSQIEVARQRAKEWKGVQQTPSMTLNAFVSRSDNGVRVPTPAPRIVGDSGPEIGSKPQRAATGFFINSEGGVLTSLKIVKSCQQIVVRTFGGEKRAELAGEDGQLGLAVVAIEGGGGNSLAIAAGREHEASAVKVGYQMVGSTASESSALGKFHQDTQQSEFKADLSPDPPLAGGPVLNAAGYVVAVAVAEEKPPAVIDAGNLLRFLRTNRVPLDGRVSETGDLSEIAAAAKKSLVLVECKATGPLH